MRSERIKARVVLRQLLKAIWESCDGVVVDIVYG